jgi:hypothetical protein
MEENLRNILSIRGGRIRGIIPCCCLMKLESQLGGVTRDHIEYCGGTSTGALLTAAVAAGIPASVNRQWPGVMKGFNPLLPSDIDEADLSAIPTLVEIGQKMAADLDWEQIIGGAFSAAPVAE